MSARGYDDSSYTNPSPQMAYRDDRGHLRQPSPDTKRDSARLLSTSVPASAPIYDH